MGILSDLKEFLFDRKKKHNEEIQTVLERISPYKFFQELADYAQSLGFTVAEGISDSGFSSSEPNYAVHGIQFKMYGMIVAVVFNTYVNDNTAAGIYYTSGGTSGEFSGPFTITTLKRCKEDLYKVLVKQKEIHQQFKLDNINEDFV